MLTLFLLGQPQLQRDGRPLDVTRRKSRALLYYLAASPVPVLRERALDLLWPDLERPAAQQVLRTTLHGLRRNLGTALYAADDTLALDPATEVDVRRFAALLTGRTADLSALAQALALYRGGFLEGFSLPDSLAFASWLTAEREHYRQLAVRGFVSLAGHEERRQSYSAALAAITRALAFDPLQEDLQRNAMRLQYLAGDRVGAIRRYEHLRVLLDEELGVPPMAETRALYDAIITDSLASDKVTRWQEPALSLPKGDKVRADRIEVVTRSPDHPVTFSELPFVGRAAELARLHELAFAGQLLLIEGEPGIGKTRLAEQFVSSSGALVLSAVARELEQSLSYQPVIEALRGLLALPEWPALQAALTPHGDSGIAPIWLSEAARLVPELGRGLPEPPIAVRPLDLPVTARPPDESRLWEGLHQLLRALAHQRPIVVLLDDLHWADASTLALLGYLVRQAAPPAAGRRVMFLATSRPIAPRLPLAALRQALTREGRLARIELKRLSDAEIATIAHELSPRHAEALAAWLARSSEGNPYILAEMVRYAREQRLLHADGSLAATLLESAPTDAAPIVPQTVYSLIQSRIDRLSDPARRVLDAAVAAGREFEAEVVTHAAGLSEPTVLDALDELRAAALVHPLHGLHYGFDHSLIMEVAYREVGEARHRLLHRRIAEALESVHRHNLAAVAGLVASHFSEGGAPERAAPFAFRAGQHAAALAGWQEAIAFYEQALVGADRAQQARVQIALGEAYEQRGDSARASEAFRAALRLTAPTAPAAAAARLRLALALLSQARYAEAIDLAQQVLAEQRAEQAATAEFIWGTALSLEGADLRGAVEHLKRAELLFQQQPAPPDHTALIQVRFEMGSIAAQQGNLEQAVALYREALATAQAEQSEGALIWRVLANNNLAYHLHLLGDPAAIAYGYAGLALAQERGVIGMQTYLRSTLGEIALAAGDIDAAEHHFAEGLALAEQLSIPERIAGLTANLGLVALRRGEPTLAVHRLSTALARAEALGTRHLATQIRIWLAPLLPPAEARATLAEARARAESGGRKRLLAEIVRLEQEL